MENSQASPSGDPPYGSYNELQRDRVIVRFSPRNQFVTVYDYISAVVPWFMTLYDDIVTAKTIARPQPYAKLPSRIWMVARGPAHTMEDQRDWIRPHRAFPAISASTLARLPEVREMEERVNCVSYPFMSF
ncbi:hypothetical protein BX600DRAFT_11308 [Xylariales sp. PMI_506]|nr:hypothetical protein BX600DRAFT_11308 [Xylariales sp. PMI_506]